MHKTRFYRLSLWILLVTSIASSTCLAAEPGSSISKILAKKANQKVQFSIHFCDASTGKTIYEHHANRPLTPASNMKLLTSAAALDQLGSDFEFETQFGLMDNNLTVVAYGDPLTGDPVLAERYEQSIYYIFDQVLAKLKEKNITSIEGDLLIDDTLFDDERFHPSWPLEQENKWYEAQVSALNFNDNCIDVHITPGGSARALVSYTLTPQTSYVNISNKCTTITKGPNTAWGSRNHDTNEITLRGTSRTEQTFNVTVDRPSAFFGYVMAEYLLSHGISINGKLIIKELRLPNSELPDTMEILYTHKTALKAALSECNERSLNLVAECLLKTLGARYQPPAGKKYRQGTWANGREAVTAFLNKLAVDDELYHLDDGSGLSHDNKLSARCITTILCHMHKHPDAEFYRNSLATPEKGTIARKNRFSDDAYENRIFGKTGYVSGTRSLSGYCVTKEGRWLAFSILSNNRPATNDTIDSIVKAVIK